MSIAAQLSPNPILQFFDVNGAPLNGGTLETFNAGTSTHRAAFLDASGTPAPNPLTLDSAGRIPNSTGLWIDNGGYKFVLKSSNNVIQWTQDNIFLVPPGFIGSLQIANGAVGTAQLAPLSVTSPIIANGAVTTTQLADDAVTTEKIVDGNVTIDELDPNLDVSGLTKNIEILMRNPTDLGWEAIPQFQWNSPNLITNPSVLPSGSAFRVAWSPDEQFVAISSNASPFVNVYQRFGNVLFSVPMLGTNPASAATPLAWSPDGQFLAVGVASSPFIVIYQKFGMTMIALPNPATLPAGPVNGVSWARGSSYLACAHNTSPFVTIYKRTSVATTGAGLTIYPVTFTKITNPATLPAGNGLSCQFTPDGQFLAIGSDTTPFINVYQNQGGTFVASTNPSTLPGGNALSVAWCPDRTLLALTTTVSPFNLIYPMTNGAFGTPFNLPTGGGTPTHALSFSQNGFLLAIGGGASNVLIFSRSGQTFTLLAAPASAPNSMNGCEWSPTNQFLGIASGFSPFIQVLQTSTVGFQADSVAWVREMTGD